MWFHTSTRMNLRGIDNQKMTWKYAGYISINPCFRRAMNRNTQFDGAMPVFWYSTVDILIMSADFNHVYGLLKLIGNLLIFHSSIQLIILY